MKVEIPANTNATIFFPGRYSNTVLENGKPVKLTLSADGKYSCKVGSGSYTFSMND
jgi:hypothetical protein